MSFAFDYHRISWASPNHLYRECCRRRDEPSHCSVKCCVEGRDVVIFLILPMTPLQAIVHTKPNGSIGQYANQACRNALFRRCTCQQSCILLGGGQGQQQLAQLPNGVAVVSGLAIVRACSSVLLRGVYKDRLPTHAHMAFCTRLFARNNNIGYIAWADDCCTAQQCQCMFFGVMQ